MQKKWIGQAKRHWYLLFQETNKELKDQLERSLGELQKKAGPYKMASDSDAQQELLRKDSLISKLIAQSESVFCVLYNPCSMSTYVLVPFLHSICLGCDMAFEIWKIIILYTMEFMRWLCIQCLLSS